MSSKIGAKNIKEVAPKLTTARKVSSEVLARLVMWKRIQDDTTKCRDYRELAVPTLRLTELRWALKQTGFDGTIAQLSRKRYFFLFYRDKPEEWFVTTEMGRVRERLSLIAKMG